MPSSSSVYGSSDSVIAYEPMPTGASIVGSPSGSGAASGFSVSVVPVLKPTRPHAQSAHTNTMLPRDMAAALYGLPAHALSEDLLGVVPIRSLELELGAHDRDDVFLERRAVVVAFRARLRRVRRVDVDDAHVRVEQALDRCAVRRLQDVVGACASIAAGGCEHLDLELAESRVEVRRLPRRDRDALLEQRRD